MIEHNEESKEEPINELSPLNKSLNNSEENLENSNEGSEFENFRKWPKFIQSTKEFLLKVYNN